MYVSNKHKPKVKLRMKQFKGNSSSLHQEKWAFPQIRPNYLLSNNAHIQISSSVAAIKWLFEYIFKP